MPTGKFSVAVSQNLAVWLVLGTLLFGAITFTRAQENKPSAMAQKKLEQLPLSKEIEEEKRENDKIFSKEDIESVLTSTRGVALNKNASFSSVERNKITRIISEFIGVPYMPGGNSIDGIDCGAFVANIYKQALGWEMPRSSTEQFKRGLPIHRKELRFGDLVFFNTNGQSASHVGIYLDNTLFAHASVSIGVTISSLESPYYKKRFEEGRRLAR